MLARRALLLLEPLCYPGTIPSSMRSDPDAALSVVFPHGHFFLSVFLKSGL
jgi:hypothetical protein